MPSSHTFVHLEERQQDLCGVEEPQALEKGTDGTEKRRGSAKGLIKAA